MQNRTSSRPVPRLLATAVLAVLLALGAAACGSDSASDGSSAPVAPTDTPADGAETDAPDTDDAGDDGSGELPDGWPTDLVPVPSGFEVVSAQNAGMISTIALNGPGSASAADILSDWADRLEAGGFDVTDRDDTSIAARRTGGSEPTMMVDASVIDFDVDEVTQLTVTVKTVG